MSDSRADSLDWAFGLLSVCDCLGLGLLGPTGLSGVSLFMIVGVSGAFLVSSGAVVVVDLDRGLGFATIGGFPGGLGRVGIDASFGGLPEPASTTSSAFFSASPGVFAFSPAGVVEEGGGLAVGIGFCIAIGLGRGFGDFAGFTESVTVAPGDNVAADISCSGLCIGLGFGFGDLGGLSGVLTVATGSILFALLDWASVDGLLGCSSLLVVKASGEVVEEGGSLFCWSSAGGSSVLAEGLGGGALLEKDCAGWTFPLSFTAVAVGCFGTLFGLLGADFAGDGFTSAGAGDLSVSTSGILVLLLASSCASSLFPLMGVGFFSTSVFFCGVALLSGTAWVRTGGGGAARRTTLAGACCRWPGLLGGGGSARFGGGGRRQSPAPVVPALVDCLSPSPSTASGILCTKSLLMTATPSQTFTISFLC